MGSLAAHLTQKHLSYDFSIDFGSVSLCVWDMIQIDRAGTKSFYTVGLFSGKNIVFNILL